MARLDALLRALKENGGSDLHLAAGGAARMRVRGELSPIEGAEVTDDAALRDLISRAMTDRTSSSLEDGMRSGLRFVAVVIHQRTIWPRVASLGLPGSRTTNASPPSTSTSAGVG